MKIEDGKFYFINDEYFDLFKDYKLMQNKENGTKRPCYLCFKDINDDDIIWFIPISHKENKYKKIYNEKLKKRKNVYNFVFGEVLGEEKVFLIPYSIKINNTYLKFFITLPPDLLSLFFSTANVMFSDDKWLGKKLPEIIEIL